MKTLAINTAFMNADLAVSNNEKSKCLTMDSNCKHSENLLVNIENLLNEVNLKANDLEYISVCIGPGSFTGLRISVATAKAFMVTNSNLKAIKINSLELLAYKYFKENKADSVCVLLNALSGYYYFAEYNSNLEELTSPTMITKENFKILENKKIISNEKIDNLENEIEEYNSEILLEYSELLIKQNKFTTEENLLPLYIRASQAEDNLKKRG